MRNLLTASFLALAAAGPAAAERICGLPGGEALRTYQDSVDNAPGGLAGALAQLYSFPDIQRLIASAGPAKVCATGIALSKNLYQYHKYLIVLDIQAPGKRLVTPLILQTASVQAYENVGAKPWLGLPRQDLLSTVRDALSGAEWTEGRAQEFSEIGRIFNRSSEPVDDKSISILFIPEADPAWTTFLISRLRIYGGANVFTSQYLLDVAAVQFEPSGRARWALLPGFFSRYTALEDRQAAASPGAGASDEVRLETLQRISR